MIIIKYLIGFSNWKFEGDSYSGERMALKEHVKNISEIGSWHEFHKEYFRINLLYPQALDIRIWLKIAFEAFKYKFLPDNFEQIPNHRNFINYEWET